MFSLKLLLLKITLRPLFMELLWMGFNCLKATDPPQRDSLLFITQPLGLPGTHLVNLRKMKG